MLALTTLHINANVLVLIDVTIICHSSVHRSWTKPDFALGDHVRQRHVVVLSPPGNASTAAIYVVSLTIIIEDIKSLLK